MIEFLIVISPIFLLIYLVYMQKRNHSVADLRRKIILEAKYYMEDIFRASGILLDIKDNPFMIYLEIYTYTDMLWSIRKLDYFSDEVLKLAYNFQEIKKKVEKLKPVS